MSKIFQYPFRPLDWAATPKDFAGDYQLGPYQVETTQRFIYGTRFLMWDGRVFKYGNAVSNLKSYHMCGSQEPAVLNYTAPPNDTAGVIGSRTIEIVIADRSEDDLAGGFVYLYDSTINNSVLRGIVGNEKSGAANTQLYLDYPLQHALTTSDYVDVFENPYREMCPGDNYVVYHGVPATRPTTGQKFWFQSWGPCHVSGGMTIQVTADQKDVVIDSQGCLHMSSSHPYYQRAGYIMTGSSDAVAGPLIMLQLGA